MELEFSSNDELVELIRQINIKYYEPFNANIFYLEELADKNFIIYVIQHRDAYSHLVRVFDYDVSTPEGKKNALSHLNQYVVHLQDCLFDTYRKILDLEIKLLLKSVHKKEVRAIEHNIAQRVAALRVMGKDKSVDDRIEGYKDLLKFISELRTKYKLDK